MRGHGSLFYRLPWVLVPFQRCRGVAQPGRAPGSGPGGRRFKSSLPDQCLQQLAILTSCWATHRGSPEICFKAIVIEDGENALPDDWRLVRAVEILGRHHSINGSDESR